jgi:hypothetical protein
MLTLYATDPSAAPPTDPAVAALQHALAAALARAEAAEARVAELEAERADLLAELGQRRHQGGRPRTLSVDAHGPLIDQLLAPPHCRSWWGVVRAIGADLGRPVSVRTAQRVHKRWLDSQVRQKGSDAVFASLDLTAPRRAG